MTNSFLPLPLNAIDVRHLRYFSIVAEECNLHVAAERLFMAQPPLSRHIKQLEERLGVLLFERHSKGLTLTSAGKKVLEIIEPLLKMEEVTFTQLKEEIEHEGKSLRIGITLAFEQGIFEKFKEGLQKEYGKKAQITLASSKSLVRDVKKGKLDIALIALPHDTSGLVIQKVNYKEPLVAVIPTTWNSKQKKSISLKLLSEKALFWFKREASPAFFDFTKERFSAIGFKPEFLEEPQEHDVLLARIAFGEGMGLLPRSFATIKRKGITYLDIEEQENLYLEVGFVALQKNEKLIETFIKFF